MIYGARFLGGVGVLALALAGCDGGDDDGADDMATSIGGSGTADGGTADGGSEEDTGDGGDDSGESADDSGDGMINCDSPPSYAADIQPIWDEKCVAACHEDGGEWFPFILTAPSYENVVGVAASQAGLLNQVEPGDPDTSYLWAKINGTQLEVGGSGVDMPKPPLDGSPVAVLTEEEFLLIETWITCDAPQ